jgi:serine/threonine protein kinase
LAEHPPKTQEETCAIGLAMASALEHTHRNNVVHRDFKPSNIIYSLDGTLKLTDVGIAKHFEGLATTASKVVGPLPYMAPEQYFRRSLGPFTDVYSLALVLYECLSGAVVIGRKRARDPVARTALRPAGRRSGGRRGSRHASAGA